MSARLESAHWNFKQTLIALDQLIRCVLALIIGLINPKCRGYADETMSAWAYANRRRWYGRAAEVLINVLMYVPELALYRYRWGHCERAYKSEQARTQLPDEYKHQEG